MKRTALLLTMALFACVVISCDKKKETEPKKTVILTMGTRGATFWDQFYEGAKTEADELGINLQPYWCEHDSDWQTFAGAIGHSDTVKNLAGIVGSISRIGIDQACARIPDGVNLVLMEGTFFPGGISEKRQNAQVKLDCPKYVKALFDNVPEERLLVFSYTSGNNLSLGKEMVRQRGDKVHASYVMSKEYVADSLKAMNLADYDAVILNSTSFVYDEVFSLLQGKVVYVSDIDLATANYIKSGQVKLDISADTYAFGKLCIDAALDGQSREVPFILTDKSNVDSPERAKFLK